MSSSLRQSRAELLNRRSKKLALLKIFRNQTKLQTLLDVVWVTSTRPIRTRFGCRAQRIKLARAIQRATAAPLHSDTDDGLTSHSHKLLDVLHARQLAHCHRHRKSGRYKSDITHRPCPEGGSHGRPPHRPRTARKYPFPPLTHGHALTFTQRHAAHVRYAQRFANVRKNRLISSSALN